LRGRLRVSTLSRAVKVTWMASARVLAPKPLYLRSLAVRIGPPRGAAITPSRAAYTVAGEEGSRLGIECACRARNFSSGPHKATCAAGADIPHAWAPAIVHSIPVGCIVEARDDCGAFVLGAVKAWGTLCNVRKVRPSSGIKPIRGGVRLACACGAYHASLAKEHVRADATARTKMAN